MGVLTRQQVFCCVHIRLCVSGVKTKTSPQINGTSVKGGVDYLRLSTFCHWLRVTRATDPHLPCGDSLSFVLLFNILDINAKKGSGYLRSNKKIAEPVPLSVRYRVTRASDGNPVGYPPTVVLVLNRLRAPEKKRFISTVPCPTCYSRRAMD